MGVVQFQISTSHTVKRVVKVRVYDSVQELRDAGVKWDTERGHEPILWERTHGVCHKFETLRVLKDDETSLPYVALIRLYKDGLRTGIIAHECTHAAVWIYQLDRELAKLDEIEHEETLAYLVGDLTSKLVNRLYALKLL